MPITGLYRRRHRELERPGRLIGRDTAVVAGAESACGPDLANLLKRLLAMKARVKWVEDVTFLGQSESGHAVVMDGPPDFGGRNLGPRPMEMLLLGMGGCTAFDVVLILKKARQAVADCEVELQATRAESEPKVFTAINVHFIITGTDLNEKQVERAVTLSAEKYCSASIMLGKTAEITHDYEIRSV